MPSIIRLLRPQQWLKNFFVFAPLIFSQHLFDVSHNIVAVKAFITFCLISSCVYIINDIFDKEADKLHPEKKYRPIASGRISVPFAIIILCIVLAIVFFISFSLPVEFQIVIIIYFVLQFFYSISLKHIVVLDIFLIASGFMLRVVGGAFAIEVPLSHWLIICTMFLALFLAIAKRRGEFLLVRSENLDSKRKVLQQYDVPYLDSLLIITTAGAVMSYTLYTVAESTMNLFKTDNLIFSTIFVLFGMFRYLFLVMKLGKGENPTAVVVKDIPILVSVVLWILYCMFLIYWR